MEEWEAYALRGTGEALRSVNDTCFVVCEAWYERDSKRRYLAFRDADGSVLNLSVPYFFLFSICSTKYNTALHCLFDIFEKAQKYST